MEKLNFGESVVDWVAEHPKLIPALEKYAIEYCCGRKSRAYAFAAKGIRPAIHCDANSRDYPREDPEAFRTMPTAGRNLSTESDTVPNC